MQVVFLRNEYLKNVKDILAKTQKSQGYAMKPNMVK
jgi:hypothetical protein